MPPAGSSQGGYAGDSYDMKTRKPESGKPGEYHSQAQRTPPNHPQDIALRNGTPPYEFPSSLSPNSVPASLRKEGADWFLMYNPRLPQKTLDVTLLHQFNHESVVCCVRFSKDGRFLATGCNRTAQIFDMRNGQMVCQLSDDTAVMEGDLYIRSVCFSPDGKYLATGAEDRQIRIWDIAKKRIFRNFTGHEQEIYSLDFSYDGHLIVSGSGDKTARIWDMETGNATILSISDVANTDGDVTMSEGVASDAGVTSVAISPDGKLVAAGSLDTIVRLWDVRTGTLLERLKGHRDSVYSVAFTPDGQGLVSGSLDKTLKYWELNIRDGKPTSAVERERGEKYAKCLLNFVGHKDYVLSVAISDDGRWIVSGSKDRGVQFWDKNGVAQLMLQGHKNSVISIDLSPVGGHLATGSGDWQARVCELKLSSCTRLFIITKSSD
ncbi:WD40 repeat-like protein [Serendipita vermifera]|nr:WD40 repeat-like protein [Serendipita vermifera]